MTEVWIPPLIFIQFRGWELVDLGLHFLISLHNVHRNNMALRHYRLTRFLIRRFHNFLNSKSIFWIQPWNRTVVNWTHVRLSHEGVRGRTLTTGVKVRNNHLVGQPGGTLTNPCRNVSFMGFSLCFFFFLWKSAIILRDEMCPVINKRLDNPGLGLYFWL